MMRFPSIYCYTHQASKLARVQYREQPANLVQTILDDLATLLRSSAAAFTSLRCCSLYLSYRRAELGLLGPRL